MWVSASAPLLGDTILSSWSNWFGIFVEKLPTTGEVVLYSISPLTDVDDKSSVVIVCSLFCFYLSAFTHAALPLGTPFYNRPNAPYSLVPRLEGLLARGSHTLEYVEKHEEWLFGYYNDYGY